MKYRAAVNFTDLKDNRHFYKRGEAYPRPGLEVSDDRIEELATDKNRSKRPLIEAVPEKKKTAKSKK